MVDIADLVTYTNFGDHRLRGFWVAVGQISPSPIDFHRRPYNTLALPCERVILPENLSRILFAVKGKVFPYSLPSVGPGADPGVQAVSPQLT